MKQQSKAEWNGFGDESTRQFMEKIKQRKAMASIYSIKGRDDQRVEGFEDVSKVMTGYFKDLLGSNMQHREGVDASVIALGNSLTLEQQLQLCRPFENDDIKAMVCSIPNHKSPGPDGFSSGFFKASWAEIGNLICSAIKEFFTEGRLPRFYGQTKLILLPKRDNPERPQDF